MNKTMTYTGKTFELVMDGNKSCRGCAFMSENGESSPGCREAGWDCTKGGGGTWKEVAEIPQSPEIPAPAELLGVLATTAGMVPIHKPATESKPTNPKDAIGITKLPMHLVSPIVKCYQAIAHFLGNVKYGAWNYRGAGVRYSIYKAALERHVDAWWEGEEFDPADGTPHLANAQACLNILIEAKYTPSSIDDRPPSRKEALAKIKAEFEPIMERIRQQYKDKDPKHFTIADAV